MKQKTRALLNIVSLTIWLVARQKKKKVSSYEERFVYTYTFYFHCFQLFQLLHFF